jgi:aminocarboxymuconate-semialdehyde decarboxylase
VGRLVRAGVVARTVPPPAWWPAARLEDMDRAGIDRQVLLPLPPVICDWADEDPATDWCLHLNDGIAVAVAERPGRFSGFGTVPLAHPPACCGRPRAGA